MNEGIKIKLTVDLTKYGTGLVPGLEGITLGPYGEWSKHFDRFVLVNFPTLDRTLDVLWESLEVIKEDSIQPPVEETFIEQPDEPKEIDSRPYWEKLGYSSEQERLDYIKNKPSPHEEELKTATNIIKTIGPLGGFISLEYDYINRYSGTREHKHLGRQDFDREGDEKFFIDNQMPIRIDKLKERPKAKRRQTVRQADVERDYMLDRLYKLFDDSRISYIPKK